METYNFFSDNDNTSFVDDDGFSNFSLRGKKYHARKRAIEEANKKANELNALINAPDVLAPLPVTPPVLPVNPATLLDIGEVNPNIPVRPNPTLPLVPTDAKVTSTSTTPTGAEVKPSESGITAPNLGTSTSKKNKFILPSVLGAALLVGLLVFLKKKK
jgi:hypothetical protein